ncbi:hypothetical protein Anapl_02182 [Anas platyrhynchos]|uniref:Uncharacterized protein n=1 Tax=Anas platyrhynchos TaxID=8839 RepID=R0JH12_ANAPL|nr:hypothetical protein Anapl_02182 [Anas platyrhynchos]
MILRNLCSDILKNPALQTVPAHTTYRLSYQKLEGGEQTSEASLEASDKPDNGTRPAPEKDTSEPASEAFEALTPSLLEEITF